MSFSPRVTFGALVAVLALTAPSQRAVAHETSKQLVGTIGAGAYGIGGDTIRAPSRLEIEAGGVHSAPRPLHRVSQLHARPGPLYDPLERHPDPGRGLAPGAAPQHIKDPR